MFILYLSLAVFINAFSVKLNGFALASKVRISLHYSHKENVKTNLTLKTSFNQLQDFRIFDNSGFYYFADFAASVLYDNYTSISLQEVPWRGARVSEQRRPTLM